MPRPLSHGLSVVVILALSVMLLACSHPHHVAKEETKVCPATDNLVVCYFSTAQIMGDSEGQFREIRRALMDALELPIEELRKPRYSDYRMVPNQWTFDQLLSRYFVSITGIEGGAKRIVPEYSADEFYEDLKTQEVVPVLQDWIKRAELSIDSIAGD